jgi:integrase
MPKHNNRKQNKSRKENNGFTICVDKGSLRIRFSSAHARAICGKPQFYLTLGLQDTPENRVTAKTIVAELEKDVFSDNVDKTLNKYRPEFRLKSKLQDKETPPEFVIPPLVSLFKEYCDYIKPSLYIGTYEDTYCGKYLKMLQKCPQDITRGQEIRDYLLTEFCTYSTKNLLGVLNDVVKWGIVNDKLPMNTKNPYELLQKRVKVVVSSKTTLKHIGSKGTEANSKRLSFDNDEVKAIIDRFYKNHKKTRIQWGVIVEFLFRTGCRHGEVSGLRWIDIAFDCSLITFTQAWDNKRQRLKPTKTRVEREFPCGPKLQALLLRIRPEDFKTEDHVFQYEGKPVVMHSLTTQWSGSPNSNRPVLRELIEEGKVRKYLKPYATRHTYINQQIRAGVKAKDLAERVGNSPGTLAKYYEDFSRESTWAPEI